MNCEFGWVPSSPYPAITVIVVVVDNIPAWQKVRCQLQSPAKTNLGLKKPNEGQTSRGS